MFKYPFTINIISLSYLIFTSIQVSLCLFIKFSKYHVVLRHSGFSFVLPALHRSIVTANSQTEEIGWLSTNGITCPSSRASHGRRILVRFSRDRQTPEVALTRWSEVMWGGVVGGWGILCIALNSVRRQLHLCSYVCACLAGKRRLLLLFYRCRYF